MSSVRPDPPRPGTAGARVRVTGQNGRSGLHSWLDPAILAAVALSAASGFAQFGVVAALGDVAQAFGEGAGGGVADQLGLSGTTLGVGLGIIRLAALGGLPLAALADRRGRKAVLLACAATGLALTAVASLAATYWVFVALFALGRPLLSATNAVVGVIAAEETRASDRAKAIALVTAAYGTGAGLTAVVRAVGGEALGFRGLFALALVPLLGLPLLARLLEEPARFTRLRATGRRPTWGIGAVPRTLWGRLAVICSLSSAAAFVTTPINSYVFAYAENVLNLPRTATLGIVVSAAPVGLLGLVSGRWAADAWGRRATGMMMHVAVGMTGVLTYSGLPALSIAGYLLGLLAGSAYAPAIGALSAEIFPTSERATAAGWLTAASAVGAVGGLFSFGAVADVLGGFRLTALLVSVPVFVTAGLFLRLPETRGLELEESAPEPV